jgi:hypothetical protein
LFFHGRRLLRSAARTERAGLQEGGKRGAERVGQAYEWLQRQLGLDERSCHIGKFDRQTCLKVVELVRDFFKGRSAA